MTEQPLDLKTTLHGIWRQRLLVGALATLGLFAGVACGILRPQLPRAVTLVVLPPAALSSSGTPARDLATPIIIARSAPVLTAAGKSVTPPVSAAQLKRQVAAKALSENVLQIEVSAQRSRDAELLANAVATAYKKVATELPSGSVGDPSILQNATTVVPASNLRIPTIGATGMGIGLFAGIILALIQSNRDHRLRLRDEIAGALGVSVLASIEAERCTTAAEWKKLLERYRPSSVDSWSLRRMLHRLAPGDAAKHEVCIISFADDRPALSAGPQLAAFAATLGIPSALVIGDEQVLVPLRAAYTNPGMSSPFEPFIFGTDGPALGAPGPELTVAVAVVDRSRPEVVPCAGASVLSVSSGFATAEDLARLAVAAADAGQAIDVILVVNPEPKDTTTGSAADGEARQRMPVRANGRSSTEPPTAGHPG